MNYWIVSNNKIIALVWKLSAYEAFSQASKAFNDRSLTVLPFTTHSTYNLGQLI